MKIKKAFPCSLLVAVLMLGASLSSPGAKLCLATVFGAREELVKLLVGKLNDKMALIKTKILGTGGLPPYQRWAHLTTESEKLAQASAELEGSMAMAQQTAGTIAVGDKTFQAQLDVLSHDRALNSTRTSLDEAGEGIGTLAKHPDLAGQDDKLAQCLREPTYPTQIPGSAPKPSAWDRAPHFTRDGYTEVEYYKDWKDLLNDPATQIGPKMWDEKLPNADAGAIAEVAVAARLKRQGHTGIQIGADELPGPLNGAKVDVLTDSEMYQVGLRGTTVRDKLFEGMNEVASGIKQALDAKPNHTFKFAFTDNNWTPLQSTIDDLNAAIRTAYGSNPLPTPPRFPLTSDHFVPFSLK